MGALCLIPKSTWGGTWISKVKERGGLQTSDWREVERWREVESWKEETKEKGKDHRKKKIGRKKEKTEEKGKNRQKKKNWRKKIRKKDWILVVWKNRKRGRSRERKTGARSKKRRMVSQDLQGLIRALMEHKDGKTEVQPSAAVPAQAVTVKPEPAEQEADRKSDTSRHSTPSTRPQNSPARTEAKVSQSVETKPVAVAPEMESGDAGGAVTNTVNTTGTTPTTTTTESGDTKSPDARPASKRDDSLNSCGEQLNCFNSCGEHPDCYSCHVFWHDIYAIVAFCESDRKFHKCIFRRFSHLTSIPSDTCSGHVPNYGRNTDSDDSSPSDSHPV